MNVPPDIPTKAYLIIAQKSGMLSEEELQEALEQLEASKEKVSQASSEGTSFFSETGGAILDALSSSVDLVLDAAASVFSD